MTAAPDPTRSPSPRSSRLRPRRRVAVALRAACAAALSTLAGCGGPSSAPTPAIPFAGWDAESCYREGIARIGRHQSVSALPYLARAAELRGDVWAVHMDYATALSNACFEAIPRRGRWGTWTRSSWDRSVVRRQVSRELDRAAATAALPAERAATRAVRGRLLATWGLERDALDEIDAALAIDPGSERATQLARRLRAGLALVRGAANP